MSSRLIAAGDKISCDFDSCLLTPSLSRNVHIWTSSRGQKYLFKMPCLLPARHLVAKTTSFPTRRFLGHPVAQRFNSSASGSRSPSTPTQHALDLRTLDRLVTSISREQMIVSWRVLADSRIVDPNRLSTHHAKSPIPLAFVTDTQPGFRCAFRDGAPGRADTG